MVNVVAIITCMTKRLQNYQIFENHTKTYETNIVKNET